MANTRKVGLKIEIDGEKEYKQAIADLNKGNQVLASELKKVSEQYKGQETSIDALNAKGDVLQRQLLQQKDKVATLQEALKNAANQYGEADRRTQEWQIKLNNAESAEYALERAVEANNQAIQEQSDSVDSVNGELSGLGDQLDDLTGTLGIQIPDAARNALNEMGGFSTGTVAAMGAAAGGIAAVYKVGKELYDLTAEAAEMADALLTRSARTGLDTDLLQQLDYAQKFLDFDGIDQSLSRLTQTMGAATVEGSKQAAAFKELGVEIYDEDGKLRNNYAVFLDVIDALGKMDDKTRADILANQLFGKSYTELKPLVEAGSDALKKYTDRAAEMGYVIDEEVIKRLGRFDDAIQENKTAVETAKTEAAGFFAPIFQSLTDLGTGIVNLGREAAQSDIFRTLLDTNPLFAALDIWSNTADAVYDYQENQALLAEVLAGVAEQAAAAAAATNDYAQAESEAAALTPENAEKIAEATGTMHEAVMALSAKYGEALTTAKESLDGQFSLWQEASSETEMSIQDMIAAQESQAAYWDEYSRDLADLQSRNIEGIEELAARFNDGSASSKEALAALREASDEEIGSLIEKMDSTEQAKNELSTRFADMTVNVTEELDKIKEEFGNTVQDINQTTGEVDFGPFETSVDEAFNFLDERAATSVENVRVQLAALSAEIDAVESRARNHSFGVPHGYNAAGTEDWRGGLTWVGEGGPELVSLPRGTQIYSAQESRQMAGVSTVDTGKMEALLERNVSLLERISGEFSGLRVKGRMAM